MFVDTHAHLFFANFKSDLDQVIDNAKQNGVDYIIVPGTNLQTSMEAVEMADKYEMVYAAAGVHPHDTAEWSSNWIEKIKQFTEHKKVVAIGEIGLDYYYDFSPKEKQIQAFESQIELAIEKDLPIIVHNRESNTDVMNIIRKYAGKGLRGQFHCFAGSIKDARELVEMGFYISFTGNVTFAKADSIRNVLKRVEVDNLLLETDAPFMTPKPYRGQRNEPAYIPVIAETIAEVHNLRVVDVGRATSYNVHKLFGIGEELKLHYTYQIGESLYINVTNRCNADCIFCDRKGKAVISGYKLKMDKSQEPAAEVYTKEIGDPKKYNEIVFCGYGEPTIRWDVVKEVAAYIKANGGKTRLNTDGHGNVINKRDITPELKDLIDTVSISLNSTDPDQYAKLMRVDPEMHAEMLKFAKDADKYSNVIMSVVGLNAVDTEKAKKFVTEKLGVNFREREYF